MRNYIIGFISFCILILTVATISMSESKTTRKNELDNALGAAMEESMSVLKLKKTYEIKDNEEFTADFIQNMLVKLDADADYEVTIYTLDTEKGLLDAGVTQKYKRLFGEGKVTVRKVIIADTTKDPTDPTYCTITVRNQEGNIVESAEVETGKNYTIKYTPVSEDYKLCRMKDGKVDVSWDENTTLTNVQANTDFKEYPKSYFNASLLIENVNGNKVEEKSLPAGSDYTIQYDPNTFLVKMNGSEVDWNWDRNMTLKNVTGSYHFVEVSSTVNTLGLKGWEIGKTNIGDVHSVLKGDTLYIYGKGAMKDFDTAPWYNDRANVKNITIFSGVTSIGRNAFVGMSNLENVNFADTITSIGLNAFKNCGDLGFEIPDYIKNAS